MIDAPIVYLCAAVLLIAGVLEIVAPRNRGSLQNYASVLCAMGLLALGGRYLFLAIAGDIDRLNILGTGAIGAIALARIISCAEKLRR